MFRSIIYSFCMLFVMPAPVLFFQGCDETDMPLNAPLAELFPVDGVIDFSKLSNVGQKTLSFIDTTGGSQSKTTSVTWAVMNDDVDLYVAVQWTDETYNHEYLHSGPVDYDGVQLFIDNDGDGSHEPGEDKRMLFAADIGSLYIDQHKAADDETDTIGDGKAWLSYYADTGTYQAEFLFPLTPDSRGEDAAITGSTRYNFILYDHVVLADGTGSLASLDPTPDGSLTWQQIPLSTQGPFTRAEIPDDLTGLITFTSTHEHKKGEIYTFDPASGRIFRVTDNDLFEENVSLSHDRKKIAYHGATDTTAYSQYEIYVIGVDGTGLTQLTDNDRLDGHPGWSPDDSKIAYASFRDAKASVVVMTAAGEELADLTPPEYDDNDADWLPDGRIVFKTDRFSILPEVRIAVMDEDGTNVQQLTSGSGFVDHDPVGDATGVVFERLMASLDFATDLSALFTPWNIVEVQLEGGSEKTLVTDKWINWLPVYDPTGQYIAYLKNTGYTEARLMTREGKDLGRLIPGVTSLTYFDWK